MSANRSAPKETATKLLAYLHGLKEDRGAMADLRCALSPARLPRAWPLLARVGGVGNSRIETVAGLFAYHPVETDQGNMGKTCYLLFGASDKNDTRMRRLLSCDYGEICQRLRPVILAARAKGIPVNYEELFADLCYWGDTVKARWAREYWGAVEGEGSATAPGATA